MKCKNIECENDIPLNRVYCSLSCRNVFVNKYLRDYTKYSTTCKEKKDDKEKEYLENPKNCKECGDLITFKKSDNIFCSSSCSSTYNNRNKKGIKYNLSEEGLKSLRKSAFVNFGINPREIFEKICNECGQPFLSKNLKFCSKFCKINFHKRNSNPYKRYKELSKFKFNIADYPDEFDFSLIRKYGWYSPSNRNNNLGGVSRDHMFSIKEGFDKGIDPKIISHPANCLLMVHTENISKNKNSSITIEELMRRIEEFENKYKFV